MKKTFIIFTVTFLLLGVYALSLAQTSICTVSEAGFSEVRGESITITDIDSDYLENERVAVSTIEVFNTTRTILYLERFDYQVEEIDDFVRISCVPGGQIDIDTPGGCAAGASLIVDYRFISDFLRERSPVDGLYALSTDPLEKEVDALSSLGALADDNTVTSTGINPGNFNEFHNVGIWVAPDRSVDRLFIYVNKDVTGPGNLNTVSDWTVQMSNSNAMGTWNNVSISSVTVTLFDDLNTIYRYEIEFSSPQNASFFKAVNQTDATTANVEVTEIEAYGTEVAVPGDFDGDNDVDKNDIRHLLILRNQPASECPECDIDGDGMITVRDAMACIKNCTRPRCATE